MIKRVPMQRVVAGMWFHRLADAGAHPGIVKHSFLLTAREIDGLSRAGVAAILIDASQGVDYDEAEQEESTVALTARIEDSELADALEPGRAPESGAAGSSLEPEPESQPESQPESAAVAVESAPRASAPPRRSLEAELTAAARLVEAGREQMVELFNDARLGRALNPTTVAPLVAEISSSVSRHPDAFISVVRLKRHDDYTYLHSVAVCALMVALARRMGLSDEDVREAGTGGLMHDIGKAAMPLDVLNKPGPLTDDEFRIMKAHPQAGHQMLLQGGGVSASALEIALHHHEKIDGSGYPQGQAGDQISLLSRMGAVCDVYDAISSNRPYKKAWSPAESIRRMAAWKGHFDPAVFNAFVRSVGIYPVGALVRLQSDHLAVVLEQDEQSLLTPKVRIFYSAKRRMQVFVRDLDLSAPGCGDRIAGVESPEAWGFSDLEKLWRQG
jgi:putative nucleotidyltransferase with HDIG domain